MPLSPQKIIKCLLALCLLFGVNKTIAQSKYDVIIANIDSLSDIGLPKSALIQVDRLDSLARKNNNAAGQIRAVIYRMNFQSDIEENSLLAIIDRLKADVNKADYPVKPVLQSLLAQMYWNYYQQYRYQFSQRSRLQKPDSDFTKWDLQTIINETGRLYDLSLKDVQREQNTSIAVLDGALTGDSSTRYLRPILYDLLVNRALDFYLADEPALTKPQLPFTLNNAAFFSDSRTFAGLVVNSTDTASTYYKGIKYLQQSTAFHLKNGSEEAVADIDLKRLVFLQSHSNADYKDSLYLNALKVIATKLASKPISSEALVLEGKYYNERDSLVKAYGFFKQAIDAYPETIGGKNALALNKVIQHKQVEVTAEDINIPNKPMLALLNYRNISAAKVSIYHLSTKQLAEYAGGDNFYEQFAFKLRFLKKLMPVQSKELKWRDPKDYHEHHIEFKIDPLTMGNYVLMVKDTASIDESLTGLSTFKVSNLAYTKRINPNGTLEIRVTDRETGKPLNGVNLKLQAINNVFDNSTKKNIATVINEDGISNKDGRFYSNKMANNTNIKIVLIAKGDTLDKGATYVNGSRVNYNDETEVPEDKTILFTDRQIYRPGQTIYFKALQLQTLNGKSKIMPDRNVEVEFNDVNGKQLSILKLKTNGYGTVSGSFIIPQSILNGDLELSTDDGKINVRVEEYKRPTFQVEFLPLKGNHKLNDTIAVQGNVMAFSGYGLSQARVAYHITRSVNHIYNPQNYQRVINFGTQTTEIKTDTVSTDNAGNYKLKFKAIEGSDKSRNYTYQIKADVTDASGETHSAETAIIIGNNDIQIGFNLPDRLLVKDSINTPFNVYNLNGQAQKATVKVEVYALKGNDLPFKTRLWRSPDQFIIDRASFKKDFPLYAYDKEDEVATWGQTKRVLNLELKTDGEKTDTISLNELRRQLSGEYKIVLSARNENGDTTSVIKYISLINENYKPLDINDWVLPILSAVKPGASADFLVGINRKINVLVERYNGVKMISSKWITIDKQEHIKIPITDTNKNVAVQFTMVYDNRVYDSYQKIYIVNPVNDLKVKSLTFHNKLQPGQKEQWKLQITNQHNEKQAAEMLADLYDASLDDITPAGTWANALSVNEPYQNNYFSWSNYDFMRPVVTMMRSNYYGNAPTISRSYEQLNMLGYNNYGYNGNYQANLQHNSAKARIAEYDRKLHRDYLKNAALVKDGYDISGKVIDEWDKVGLTGVSVIIKGTGIQTTTNSTGAYRIKVPLDALLEFRFVGFETKEIATTKAGNVMVALKLSSSELNEVVVTGYSVQRKRDVSAAVTSVRINGADLLQGKAAGVQIVNDSSNQIYGLGVPGAGDKFEMRQLNTNPGIKFKKISFRKNFNETAFFYPQLQTDENGDILIDFTIPEALTRWKFRGLAITKDLQKGYIENTVITQKQLSITANTPRFLREGDTITIAARLANLTGKQLKGKVQIQLFNALNMQPVTLLVNKADTVQLFAIEGAATKAVSFRLAIPSGLDAITYRLTADAGEFTDGEENTLPILPNRMLVTESMPMMVRPGQTHSFTFNKLVNQNSTTLKNKTLTLEYTQNPAWYAVQALPYMMEFPYECSEQVFSRYFANSLATSLVNRLPAIKQVFEQWKSTNSTALLSNLEKNQELKETLIEETPWLKDETDETEQKRRIALLFDLNKMSDELKLNLDKLKQRQLPDGGFTWFGGDSADRFMTQHILEGIGELYHLGIADKKSDLVVIGDNAIKYLDEQLVNDQRERKKSKGGQLLSDIETQAWFARSYFLNQSMSRELKLAFADYLNRAAAQWTQRNVYEQGMIALTTYRYKKTALTMQIEASLLERAQQSDELGMYWANNKQGYFWYQAPIETQSLLIELFTEAGGYTKAVEEMKIWLLRNKQTNDWQTTKATAAAC